MIRFIISQGVGFSPGSVKYLPTLGFSIGAAVVVTPVGMRLDMQRQNARVDMQRAG